MSTVSAIIPTWNRADLLESILANLRGQTRPPDQIIVVDNGSRDNTGDVSRRFDADLITFPENRGFSAAVNAGIEQSNCEWLLIANNDVVLQPQWLDRLLTAAMAENAPFAAGKLMQTADQRRIDGTWDMVSRAAYAWRCGYGRLDGALWSARRRIWFAPMTAALFHRSVFEKIGLLDTRFEAYYEDVDFGIRCTLAGLEGIYEPSAVAVHGDKTTLGRSSPRTMFLTARNQVLLLAKHYSRKTLWRFAWPILVGQLLGIAAAANQGQFFPALRGKWEGLRQWSAFRGERIASPEMQIIVEAALTRSERELHQIQRTIGFDPYWRIYFSLVRSG
jgi:GT2 family glycosyltransferase